MKSLLLSGWDNFSNWVTTGWSDAVYGVVVGILAIIGMLGLLYFFKGNFNKGKKIKWGRLILSIICFAVLAIITAARYA